jgi:hypothetical protein
MQRELDKFREEANSRRVRKQRDKALPSGVSPNVAYTFPEKFGGENCLQLVDIQLVEGILNDMQKEKEVLSDWGVPLEFRMRAQEVYEYHGSPDVTMETVWLIFSAMVLRL